MEVTVGVASGVAVFVGLLRTILLRFLGLTLFLFGTLKGVGVPKSLIGPGAPLGSAWTARAASRKEAIKRGKHPIFILLPSPWSKGF